MIHFPQVRKRLNCNEMAFPLLALSGRVRERVGDDRHLAMQPSRLSEFITAVRERFEAAARKRR